MKLILAIAAMLIVLGLGIALTFGMTIERFFNAHF